MRNILIGTVLGQGLDSLISVLSTSVERVENYGPSHWSLMMGIWTGPALPLFWERRNARNSD